MKYEKCCRNCEYAYLTPQECKGCETFGDNKYGNFKLREELAKIENGDYVSKEDYEEMFNDYQDLGKICGKLQAECDDKERYINELYNRAKYAERELKELKTRIAKGEIVELPNDIQTVLLRTIVWKTKFARTDYFSPFETKDDFGQPQIMSMDEQFYRTVIRLLGIKSREEAEVKLAELKGEK